MTNENSLCLVCEKLLADRMELAKISTRLTQWVATTELTRRQRSDFINIMFDYGVLVSSDVHLIKKMTCGKQ